MNRLCDFCKKEYNADNRNVKRGWGLCCSKSCAASKREADKLNDTPAIISDADYIKELEGFARFLASCYEKAKETYFDKHMETSSVANPNRRDLTEAEQKEWQRFPLVQGLIVQDAVSKIAKSNKPNPIDLKQMMKRFLM